MKKYTYLKILFLVFYLLTTFILTFTAVDILSSNDGLAKAIGLTLYLILFWGIIGFSGFSVSLIIAIFGLILSSKNYKKVELADKKKGSIIFFSVAVFLPIITQTVFALILT